MEAIPLPKRSHEPHALLFSEEFRDLDGVQGGSFPQLISHDPNGQSVFKDMVDPDPAYAANLLFSVVDGHWVAESVGEIPKFGSREAFEGGPGIRYVYRALEFRVNRNRVSPIYRDSNAGA